MYPLLLGVACYFVGVFSLFAHHIADISLIHASSTPVFIDTALPEFRNYTSEIYIDRQDDIIRSRFGTINFQDQFPDILTFNCFSDATFLAIKQRKEQHTIGATSTIYQLEGEVFGYAIVTYSDERLFVKIQDGQGRVFIISPETKGAYAIAEIDNSIDDEGNVCSQFIQQEFENSGRLNTKRTGSICEETTEICDPATVDVMVLYTDDVGSLYGDATTASNAIANAIAEANQALINSGVVHQFQLVHTAEVLYEEDEDLETTIIRLEGATDGYLDNIHSLRNTYEADLVALIVSSGNGCGVGTVNTNAQEFNTTKAFNVTKAGCMMTNLTLAHEMGHNLGLHHDWYVNQSTSPCDFAHGYVNDEADAGTEDQRWRTIMAYNQQCVDAGYNCARLPYFSNPNIQYNNDLVGRLQEHAEPADGAFILNRSMCKVADFKENSAAQPNLTTQVNTASLTISEENIVNIEVIVENNSLVASDATEIAFYLSRNTIISENDEFVEKATIPTLEAGETSAHILMFDAADLEIRRGTFYIGHIIDNQNVVIENTESDNIFYFDEPQLIVDNVYCEGQITWTASSGSFSDGSLDKNYRNNSSCYWLIRPPEAESIQLEFTNFLVEDFYDRVEIYDGSNTAAQQIGSYHNGNLPPPQIESTGGALLIHFLSDNTVNEAGWAVNYTATMPENSLPLQLVNFVVEKQNGSAFLQWKTSDESGVNYFEIERSLDGRKWEKVGQEINNTTNQYAFIDSDLSKFLKHQSIVYYRLKIVELDGGYLYSVVRNLLIDTEIGRMSVFPNPVQETLNIRSDLSLLASLQIVNVHGQVVKRWSTLEHTANKEIQVTVSDLPQGVYWLMIFDEIQQLVLTQRIFIVE